MDVILVAILLIVVGLIACVSGYLLFRLLLPIIAFMVGFGVGFSGIQAIFGSNIWSFAAALLTAILIGVIFSAVSYFYYTVGVMVLSASIFAGLFAFFGQAIGLRDEGFIIALLSFTGAIIGGLTVLRYGLQHSFIVVLTSLFGTACLLVSLFLLVGSVSLSELHRNGILATVNQVVDNSWLWFFVLVTGTVLSSEVQRALIAQAVLDDTYVISN